MTFKWLVVLAAILMLGYHLSNEFFIRLFTNIEEVVAMAMTYNVFVLFYPVCAGIGMVLYGVFCGATGLYAVSVNNTFILFVLFEKKVCLSNPFVTNLLQIMRIRAIINL